MSSLQVKNHAERIALSRALCDAILKDDAQLCKDIIEQGPELNLPVSERCNGCTPLILALEYGCIEIADLLIRKGATISGEACEDMGDHWGYTAFHFAAMGDEFSGVLDLLLDRSSDLNCICSPVHPVHIAIANGNDQALGKLLDRCFQTSKSHLSRRSSNNPTSWNSDTHRGFSCLAEVKIQSLDLDREWSLSKSYFISTDDVCGTPLHIAVYSDNCKAAALLLDHGANIESLDDQDRTPLHVAADSGNFEVAALLLNRGANPNARDKTLKTPSMLAAAEGSDGVLQLLKNLGADLTIRSDRGYTALHFALNFPDVRASLLDDRNALCEEDSYGYSLAQKAFSYTTPQDCAFFLNSHLELTACTLRMGSIIQTVAMLKSSILLKCILRRLHPEETAKLINFQAQAIGSPLYMTAAGGYARNTELLIEAGAEIDLEGGRLGTPLMGACESGHLRTVKILVRRGAMLSYLDKNGKEVSALAFAKYHPRVVRWLLVSRHTEQSRLCQTSDASTDGVGIVPWAGLASVPVFRPRAYRHSLLDHLHELGEFRKRYLGKVYYPPE